MSGDRRQRRRELQRIVLFVGLRLDSTIGRGISGINGDGPAELQAATMADQQATDGPAAQKVPGRRGFPESAVQRARDAISQALKAELALGDPVVLGIAAGANGGDLLFHEACRELAIPTRMCLALPRPQYVGQYVAPAGPAWMQRFSATYRALATPAEGAAHEPANTLHSPAGAPLQVFTDSFEMPRWLQGKPFYNVGRRNNLWMLQHALTAAYEAGDNVEITLLALWNPGIGELGIGGIGHVIQYASAQGIKVVTIAVPSGDEAELARGVDASAASVAGAAASSVDTGTGTVPAGNAAAGAAAADGSPPASGRVHPTSRRGLPERAS